MNGTAANGGKLIKHAIVMDIIQRGVSDPTKSSHRIYFGHGVM